MERVRYSYIRTVGKTGTNGNAKTKGETRMIRKAGTIINYKITNNRKDRNNLEHQLNILHGNNCGKGILKAMPEMITP